MPTSAGHLSDANLSRHPTSTDANLGKVDLTEVDLSGPTSPAPNLAKANLTDADLTDADLGKANLTDADLSGADLSNAQLGKVNLTDVRSLRGRPHRRKIEWRDLTGRRPEPAPS